MEGIQGVLRCLRNTIRKRRPLHRIRSDYLAKHLHVQKVAKFGKQGENLNLYYKDLAAQFEACSFDKMQFQDLLTYTLFFHIVEVDLKETVVKLWKAKEELGQHLLPADVLAVIESWHDVRNQASDKAPPPVPEPKVFSLSTPRSTRTGSSPSTFTCSICAKPDHQRTDCPLKKSGAVIYCSHHPELQNSHTTEACRNPNNSLPTSSGGTGNTRGTNQDRGSRSRGRGRRGRGRGTRGRSRSKE